MGFLPTAKYFLPLFFIIKFRHKERFLMRILNPIHFSTIERDQAPSVLPSVMNNELSQNIVSKYMRHEASRLRDWAGTIRRTLRTGFMASMFLTSFAAPSSGFVSGEFSSWQQPELNNCWLAMIANVWGRGYVRVRKKGPVIYIGTAGGIEWKSSVFHDPGYGSITSSVIAECLDTDVTNIINLQQNGANGTYATDTYIGFSFNLAVAAGGFAAGFHEYALTASSSNTAPTANAGTPQTVASGTSPVTLNGSGSNDIDGQPLRYTWSVPAGVTLSDPSAKNPTFTAPTLIAGAASQTLTFGLIVNDGLVDSSSSSVTITFTSAPNTAPTANAGPAQSVASASLVTLDGAGSNDIDSHPPQLHMERTGGRDAVRSERKKSDIHCANADCWGRVANTDLWPRGQ